MASGHEDIPNKPDCSVPNLRTKQEFNDEIDRLPKDTKFKPQSLQEHALIVNHLDVGAPSASELARTFGWK